VHELATSYPATMESARVVLVTNVGQGFGRAVALAYGQAGYDVVCADPDVDLASKTAAEVEELGAQAIPVQADMTAQLDVRGAFTKVHEIFGALGGVVHVACHQSQTSFARLADGEFAELFRENVTSTFLVLREAARPVSLAWVVIVTPPRMAGRPQMAAVHGAVTSMAAAFGSDPPSSRPEVLDLADVGAPEPAGRPRVNVVVPSRGAADPRHDARLANAVRYLGSMASRGVSGTTIEVELPPPPRLVETLLPEVRAALDDTLRQDDRLVDRDDDDADFDDDPFDDGREAAPEDEYDDDDEAVEHEASLRRVLSESELDGEDAALEREGLDERAIAAAARTIAAAARGEPGNTFVTAPRRPPRR
jgi:NAD(P)-dependent dehydrogenase (short-subunit alcohol dehydrogenase family)